MDDSAPLDFTPVPVRGRRDGWTPERQRAFIAAIAGGMASNHAARAVGMSKQTAHALRGKPGAGSFAAAWDEAVRRRKAARRQDVSERTCAAVDGVRTPVRYRGRVVGFQTRYDNRQLVRLLSQAFAKGWIAA
jgi:transposase